MVKQTLEGQVRHFPKSQIDFDDDESVGKFQDITNTGLYLNFINDKLS